MRVPAIQRRETLVDTMTALTRSTSGIDYLNEREFPYWYDAIRIGNLNQFLAFLNEKDKKCADAVIANLSEFQVIFARIQRDTSLTRTSRPVPATHRGRSPVRERHSFATSKSHKEEDGWIEIAHPDIVGAIYYYNIRTGKAEWSAKRLARSKSGGRLRTKRESTENLALASTYTRRLSIDEEQRRYVNNCAMDEVFLQRRVWRGLNLPPSIPPATPYRSTSPPRVMLGTKDGVCVTEL